MIYKYKQLELEYTKDDLEYIKDFKKEIEEYYDSLLSFFNLDKLNRDINMKLWNNIDATYHRSNKGGGEWEVKNPKLNNKWDIHY